MSSPICRFMRLGRRPPRPRAPPGSPLPRPATTASSSCSSSIDPALRLLHLCGRDRIDVQSAPQAITPVPVYESRPLAGIDPGPLDGCVVMVHSPRAGRALAELAGDRSSIAIAAISAAAADAAGPGWAEVEAADAPTDDALLALAARLCKKGRGQ